MSFVTNTRALTHSLSPKGEDLRVGPQDEGAALTKREGL